MGELKDKLEGKARELKGKVTDDRGEELKGKAQQVKGAAEGKLDDLKDAWANRNSEGSDGTETDGTYAGEGYSPAKEQQVD
jgi:uncharacterized protein YjbJ (UPF0337 family)